MDSKQQLDTKIYRVSWVNCYDASQPSSDDFDFPGYSSSLKLPPKTRDNFSWSTRRSKESNRVSA